MNPDGIPSPRGGSKAGVSENERGHEGKDWASQGSLSLQEARTFARQRSPRSITLPTPAPCFHGKLPAWEKKGRMRRSDLFGRQDLQNYSSKFSIQGG